MENEIKALSIVIPVYNGQETIRPLTKAIHAAIKNHVTDYELIFVNDDSPDNSWETIRELAFEFKQVRGISLRKNYGQHNAVMAGLSRARGNVIILMDDDLQHDPAYIPKMYQTILDGADVCYTRYIGRKHSPWKILGSRFNNLISSILLHKPYNLYLSSFKAMAGSLAREIVNYQNPFLYLDGVILQLTNNCTSIDIQHNERTSGGSGYSLRKCLKLWSNMITGFSIMPLRIAIVTGMLISLAAFAYGFYVVWQKMINDIAIQGWASLIVLVAFLGGAQLIFIGIVGEYIGRAYLKLNSLPQFSVRETVE